MRIYSFHGANLAHDFSRIERGDGSVCLLRSLHGDKPEPTGLAGMRVIHDRSLFDLFLLDQQQKIKPRGDTYTANFSKRCFEVTRINTMAQV